MSAVATLAPTASAPQRLPLPGRPSTGPYAARRQRPAGDPTPLACTVARSAVEVALGMDGVDRLTRWVTPSIHASLARQSALARRAGYRMLGAVGIQRVRLQRVSATTIEAAIVAREGRRGRAVAMRLEDRHGRWIVTALDIG